MSPKTTVLVRDLEKRYDGVHAARGVSFEIREGEIFGLIGPNGAGKTTTVECVLGLREPDSGHIEVCGIDARRRPRDVKRKIGAALQTTALQDKITPREAVTLFAAFYGALVEPRALLNRFGLADKADAPFDTLSGGQRQRLALALAFVNNPELVLLDEPTAGLDAHSRHELHDAIAQMKRDGHTVLLTTHYLDEAEKLCDRIAIIDRGQIVATGSPIEIVTTSTATPTVTLRTLQPANAGWFTQIPGLEGLDVSGNVARFRTTQVTTAVSELLRRLDDGGVEIAELRVQKAALEDVFLQLTSSNPGSRPFDFAQGRPEPVEGRIPDPGSRS